VQPNPAAASETQAGQILREQGRPHSRFSAKQRLVLWLISWAGYLAIRIIGPTLRISVQFGEGAEGEPRTRPAIFCFWHRCVFPAAYLFRKRGIRVLTSRSYDGEYIARIIERLGFRAVRGSSSRGALLSLRELQRELARGEVVAFTIDGPRGPRYVAKPGPIHLAQTTGAPIFPFYVAVERAWVLKTWDAFIVPMPFSRVHCYIHSPTKVSPASDFAPSLAQMQSELEKSQRRAEAAFRARN
jgi:lysophospholipid acyltransferase (LPLAT)-like uncharacterized protein